MAVESYAYRWSLEEFLRVWEAGAFSNRAELLDGEVYDVPIGHWHARTTGRTIRALPNGGVEILPGWLASGESLPEPDCRVLRGGAEPMEQLSPRMQRFAARDVLLVVEVSDETVDDDLGRKAVIYAESGFPHYWVITQGASSCTVIPDPAATAPASCTDRESRSRFPTRRGRASTSGS